MGLFSKTSTYDPMSAYTPEQRKSIEALMSLASTGTGGGITLGESYGGDLGYYQQGAQGLAGGQTLQDLLSGAYDPNSDMGKARGIYEGFSDLGQFNPDDPRWGYAAFNKALEKAGAESASALEREAAIGGRRFGTAILGEKADLAENMNLQRQQRLSEMFMGAQQFSALGAQGFTGLANQVAQIAGLNINYDDYQRQLKDTKARDALNEFKRTRAEELSRLGLMQEQWQNPMGTITTKSPTMLGKLASSVLGGVAGSVGAYMGAGITGGLPGFGEGGMFDLSKVLSGGKK